MTFYVGQRVICLTDDWCAPIGVTVPKKDAIYTVRRIRLGLAPENASDLFLLLCEIVNAPQQYPRAFDEPSFHAAEFRPLTERSTETGFAILKRLLNPTRTRVNENILED